MAAVVKGDNPPPCPSQGFHPLRKNPIDRMGRRETMNEEHWDAAADRCRHLVDKGQADAPMQKFDHPCLLSEAPGPLFSQPVLLKF